MSVDAVLVNYGCPRSGTTWMAKVLAAVDDVFSFKLAEGRVLHPCQSENGLIELSKILRFRRVRIDLGVVDVDIAGLRQQRVREPGGGDLECPVDRFTHPEHGRGLGPGFRDLELPGRNPLVATEAGRHGPDVDPVAV